MPKLPHQLPLGSLATMLAGAPTKSSGTGGPPGAIPVLSVRAMRGDWIDPAEIHPAEPLISNASRYRVQSGDVLVPARSTFFTAHVVQPDLDGHIFNATLIRIRCGEQLHSRILAAYLKHPHGRAAIDAVSQSGAVQLNITVRGLSQLLVPVPQQEEQNRIAAMLEAADEAYAAAIQSAEHRRRLAGDVVMHAMAVADH